jgi:hypothetical protein
MGDGRIFQKISGPHSLMTTYRMNLISAGSIPLDGTVNNEKWSERAETGRRIAPNEVRKKLGER